MCDDVSKKVTIHLCDVLPGKIWQAFHSKKHIEHNTDNSGVFYKPNFT